MRSGSTEVSAVRAWVMAARPKTLSAAVAPVLVGTGLASYHGVLAPLPALAALVGAVLIQIATNLANDYYDFVRGGDTGERVGPTRVTQAGILTPGAVKWGMVVTLATACLVGIYLVAVAGRPIVWIGLASLASAVLYTGGPYPLAYHGWGDLFVFVFFGLVAVGGTYYVQALALPPDIILAGTGVGALSTAILVANNLRDIETDARAGKNTLAVRLGVTGTRLEYVLLVGVALAVPPVGWWVYGWPAWVWACVALAIPAAPPIRRVVRFEHPRDLLPALGGTARLVALYGAVLAATLTWGSP